MRIALCHPTYWPAVRRGSERVVHDLAVALAGRGHEVSILSTHRRGTTVTAEEGVRVVRSWRPPGFSPMRWYESFVETVPELQWRLRRERYDIVHAFHPATAWGAIHARRRGDPPMIFSFHGSVTKPYLTVRRYRLEMLEQLVRRADAITVLSAFAAESFARYLLIEPEVLPAGVIEESFRLENARANAPTLLCSADLSDPRKRGDLLLSAFARLRETSPDIQMILAGGAPGTSARFAGAPGVRVEAIDDTNALAHAYSAAWASVLPAIDEALGLVMIESLAAGTPVVAARSGASPSIVSDPDIGRLFEPDDERSLVAALRDGVALAAREGTGAACRARAAEFGWSRLIERYEGLYDRVASGV